MKKRVCIILVSILLFSAITPTISASTNNVDSNLNYSFEDMWETQIIEDGIAKTITSFYSDGQPIEITQYMLNDVEEKYTIKEGQEIITEVTYNSKTDTFFVDGELLEVEVSIETIEEPKLLDNPDDEGVSTQGYYTTPPYGKMADYKLVSTSYINIKLAKSLISIGAYALGVVIAIKCKTSTGIAYASALEIIAQMGIWCGNNYVYSIRENYEHYQLPQFYKRYFGRYFYEKYTNEARKAAKVWYYSGLDTI